MNKEKKSYFLKIHGRVQGVGFRFFCSMIARDLQIHGWVKNCSDGTVETLCEGYSDKIAQYIAKCKTGCDYSRVTKVDIEPREVEGLVRFSTIY